MKGAANWPASAISDAFLASIYNSLTSYSNKSKYQNKDCNVVNVWNWLLIGKHSYILLANEVENNLKNFRCVSYSYSPVRNDTSTRKVVASACIRLRHVTGAENLLMFIKKNTYDS